MSRYEVEALNAEQYAVIVGWDNPLQTYFAQVWDLNLLDEVEDDESCVAWVGAEVRSVPTVAALAQAIAAYAELPADIAAQLGRDREASEPPTPLQRWVLSRLTRHTRSSSQG